MSDAETNIQDFLSHHGVKGQKWGVRNKRGRGGRKPATPTNKRFEERRLSDAELNKRIKRMELEKRYNDLNKESNTVKKGESVTKRILSSVSQSTAERLLKDMAYYGGKQATKQLMKKTLGPGAAESAYAEMFPKKKK